MTQDPIITSNMRAAIGVETKPVTHHIDEGAIKKFAQAIGDDNPIFSNEEITNISCQSSLIAPPTFLRSLENNPPSFSFEIPYPDVLDGGSEWEYYLPVRPRDKITVISKIVDLEKKNGSLGNMLFVRMESRFDNQKDEPVALERSTYIYYRQLSY